MNYKQIIDSMKRVKTPAEITIEQKIARALPEEDREEYQNQLLAERKETPQPLKKTELLVPVTYAFTARAEWEMLKLAEQHGEKLEEKYLLRPSRQRRTEIGLNWQLLSKRIWVPVFYLEATDIEEDDRTIFSQDEANALVIPLRRKPTAEEQELLKKVIYGPDSSGTAKAKIRALTTDREWRETARRYAQCLLECALSSYRETVKEEYLPVLEEMINAYRNEMI